MGATLKHDLDQRWGDDWLVGIDSRQFWLELEQSLVTHDAPGSLILVVEADPLRFLTQFLAACYAGCAVMVGNPQWGEREWQQVAELKLLPLEPPAKACHSSNNRLYQQGRYSSNNPDIPRLNQPSNRQIGYRQCPESIRSKILIPTGGSSGQIKFVVHSWQTLMVSVEGFLNHFGVRSVNAYCVLPLFHVSGLMQVLRVLTSGGRLGLQSYKALKQGQTLVLSGSKFLSLVPTQLQWLLNQGDHYLPWLRGFQAVLLGGAPPWPGLLHQARQAQVPVALTYGMTETASQVATLFPGDFLRGASSNGRPLPHARIHILSDQNRRLKVGTVGRVAISASSLALGYWMPGRAESLMPLETRVLKRTLESQSEQAANVADPSAPRRGKSGSGPEPVLERVFLTDDLGCLNEQGELYIAGRRSTKLISGGENLFPEEIEAGLLTLALVRDACVVGLPDQQWGQRLCAVVVLASKIESLAHLSETVKSHLAPYKCPKDWIAVETIPRTAQGKVNRKQTLELAVKILAR